MSGALPSLRARLARHVLVPLALVWLAGTMASVGVANLFTQRAFDRSLLDDAYQERLAQRMWSLVRPGGGILWCDFVYDNPRNPDVRGVPLRRVRQLFPQGRLTARRIALPLSAFRRIKNNPPCGLSSLARGIFLFGSFLRRFDRRFRRRGGFPFNELIQLLTADRNSLE